jgi:hypothetical protein
VDVVAAKLARLGYRVAVRTAHGGGHGQDCFQASSCFRNSEVATVCRGTGLHERVGPQCAGKHRVGVRWLINTAAIVDDFRCALPCSTCTTCSSW